MSAETATPRRVADLTELVQRVELRDIRTYELRATRPDSAGGRSEEIDQEMQLLVRGDESGTEARVRMTVTTAEADLVADIGAIYRYSEPLEVEQSVIHDFVERVAVMAVFPFLRESIHTSATRLGVAVPVIGLLKAGEFRLGEPTEPAQ